MNKAILLLSMILIAACSSSGDKECSPYSNRECGCSGNLSGRQWCESDGSAWTKCDCSQCEPKQTVPCICPENTCVELENYYSIMTCGDNTLWGGCDCQSQKTCGVRVCGPDPVCGLDCGSCPDAENDICQDDGKCCTVDCGERVCGPDPTNCGGSCGDPSEGKGCTTTGAECDLTCGTRVCGANPSATCEGSCGECGENQECLDNGTCCDIDCGDRVCGPDPVCGASCGECEDPDKECNADGQCACPV